MSLNKVILIGNCGADPEIRQMQNSSEVANLKIATSENWKDKNTGEKKQKTEWHSVVIFGGLVNIVKSYVKKGSKLYIEGSLQTRKWQDKEGNDKYSTEIILNGFLSKLILLNSVENNNNSNYSSNVEDNYQDLDDDIPF